MTIPQRTVTKLVPPDLLKIREEHRLFVAKQEATKSGFHGMAWALDKLLAKSEQQPVLVPHPNFWRERK